MDLRTPPKFLRHSHVHASLINPPVQVSHLAAPEEEKHQCQHSIDALAISMPTNANHGENITSYHTQPAFSWCLSNKVIEHQIANLYSGLNLCSLFFTRASPQFFRLVKPFFHQPTHRTRHFPCRNFRPFFGPASDSVDKPDSGVERRRKGLAQRKKLVP